MDASHVAVGTAACMITDSLTAAPKKAPPERDAAAALGAVLLGPHRTPLVPPAIYAAQYERADRARRACWLLIAAGCTRPTLPPALRGLEGQRLRPSYTVSPSGQRQFLQSHDQGPTSARPPIRQGSTWEVAPRGGMVLGGSESHPGNEPGRSTCAGPGPLLPVSFAIRLTTAPLPGTAQAVGRQGGLTDLCGAMSALARISSASPPGADLPGGVADGRPKADVSYLRKRNHVRPARYRVRSSGGTHRSGSGFSGTVPSAPRPRPVGM